MLKQQWEYRTESGYYYKKWFSEMEDHLAKLGLESWEVYNVTKEIDDVAVRIVYFAKRPLTEEEANIRMRRLGMS